MTIRDVFWFALGFAASTLWWFVFWLVAEFEILELKFLEDSGIEERG